VASSPVLTGLVGGRQRDAIIRVSSTAICGSDLHIYVGAMGRSSMQKGDIVGHEFSESQVSAPLSMTDPRSMLLIRMQWASWRR
jgi:hypothetical protein